MGNGNLKIYKRDGQSQAFLMRNFNNYKLSCPKMNPAFLVPFSYRENDTINGITYFDLQKLDEVSLNYQKIQAEGDYSISGISFNGQYMYLNLSPNGLNVPEGFYRYVFLPQVHGGGIRYSDIFQLTNEIQLTGDFNQFEHNNDFNT